MHEFQHQFEQEFEQAFKQEFRQESLQEVLKTELLGYVTGIILLGGGVCCKHFWCQEGFRNDPESYGSPPCFNMSPY